MTELKTLKDIGKDTRFCSQLPMFARTELKEMLKQEAIKWIKELKKYPKGCASMYTKKFIVDGKDIINENIVPDWIKHFFNISKEDLK